MHLIVTGTVQGVGYRWFVQKTGERLGLGGWVKNCPDGTVEAEVEGDQDAIDTFLTSLRHDHRHARVDQIITERLPAGTPKLSSFEIKL